MSYQKEINTQSQYNSAAQEISRIHEIRLKIHELKRKGNLKTLNYELDNWWTELSGDKNVKPEDEKQFYQFWLDYAKNKNNRALLYQTLIKKEVFLAKLQTRLGKGSKYQKPDDSGIS